MDGQLIKFRTENHRSLRDEQELSFVASGIDDPRLLHPDGLDEALLPVLALYGANASGKSNIFDAISYGQRAVVLSQRHWEPDGGIARQPFALRTSREAASQYVFDLIVSGVRYQYGFAVDDISVVEEWLYSWPHGRKQELYTRDRSVFDFNRNLHGENRAIELLTRPNSLFLSAAAQNNHEQLRPLYEWFSLRLRVEALGPLSGSPPPWRRGTGGWWSQFAGDAQSLQSTRQRERVRALLASSDLGIEDFRVEEDKVSLTPRGNEARSQARRRICFAHQAGAEAANAWLELEQESTGTQALVRLLPYVLQLLESGGVLAIDELNSLHPILALSVIRLFQDPKLNPNGAQLLFNTHDASLLGNLLSEPPPFRRDQVWLIEKDKEGASHLYPLTDYKPRTSENLERGYLQGRYGAVPFLSDLNWSTDVSPDKDP